MAEMKQQPADLKPERIDSYKEWQPRVGNSRLLTLEGDAWHAAGAYPDRCAGETLAFIRRYSLAA